MIKVKFTFVKCVRLGLIMERIVSFFDGLPSADVSTTGLLIYTVWHRFNGFEYADIDEKSQKG